MIRPQPKPVARPRKARKPIKRLRWMVAKTPRRVTRPGPGSDPAYLAEVRKLPCRVSAGHEGDVVPHHAGPKSNDSTAVPLCVKHHQQWHDGNGVFKEYGKPERRLWATIAITETRLAVAVGALESAAAPRGGR